MTGARIRTIILLALCGTIVVAGTMLTLNLRANDDVTSLITIGRDSGAAPVFRSDIPDYALPGGGGHDGQTFYLVAREPNHLQDAAQYVDRPRYRFQRMTMPLMGWMVHPQGGGRGLVVALWLIAAGGVALTGIGAALLAGALGASVSAQNRLALLAPLLPASWITLDLTVADQLALGLVAVALALDALGKPRSALALALLAVFAKETVLLVLIGWAIRRGWPTIIRLVGVPLVAAGTWWLILRIWFWDSDEQVYEFSFVRGLVESVDAWIDGHARIAGLTVVAGVVLGIVVLVTRGWSSPLAPIIAIQIALVPMLSAIVLAGTWHGTRATAPLLLFGLVALAVPKRPPVDELQYVNVQELPDLA